MAQPADEKAPTVVVSRLALEGGGSAALVELNRPEQLNPLDWPTFNALERSLLEVEADSSFRAVLVRGRGRAFSAGGDLKSYQALQRDVEAFPRFLEDVHRTFGFFSKMSKPAVALVNGIAAAGGLEMIISCDFAIAARSAKIGDAHLTFGQMGGGGVLSLLPRMIGPARARELIFSGRYLSGEEALEWRIVNRVVDDERLLDEGLAFCNLVASRSPLALANAKYVLNTGWADGTGLDASLRLERERNALYCLTSEDAKEGLAAFAEKRKPRFQGR
jgi:enoyl-CoA hydratase/carnithine racemase